ERTPPYHESAQIIVAERSHGSFARQLSLGEGVDSENLTADYADGVLHVTIPASARSQPRRVEITHAAAAGRTISGNTVAQGPAPPGSRYRLRPPLAAPSRGTPSSRVTRPQVARAARAEAPVTHRRRPAIRCRACRRTTRPV